jgi:ADP-ribosyl-[dinitrogen reductase] hydrolase
MNSIQGDRQRGLQGLVTTGDVKMNWSPEVMECRAPFGSRRVSGDRIRGMLLGLAIGDSLGNTREGQLPSHRRERCGEVRDYLPNRYADNRSVGLPSDDTQLAFWMLEHLIEKGEIEPSALADLFASHRIFGIGKATRKFIEAIRAGKPWQKATQQSAGNGALTRIPATLLPHVVRGGADLWVDVVLGTAVTHNDRAAVGASVAFVAILAELLTMNGPPEPGWWLDRFVRFAGPIEGENNPLKPRGGPLEGQWSGPLWRFVEEFVPPQEGRTVLDASGLWYSGAFLLETAPTVLHLLIRHANDPEEAILRAVNDTKDNDSIGAIVGAAVGALHGEERLPDRWKRDLLGRTQESDDGRIFEIIDEAIQRFGQVN